jgi:hypothetical protein
MEGKGRTEMPLFRVDVTTQEDSNSKQLDKEELAN